MEQPTEKTLHNLRNYLYEYVLIALTACVVFLFIDNRKLHTEKDEILTTNQLKLMEIVVQNTSAIAKNSDLILDLYKEKAKDNKEK